MHAIPHWQTFLEDYDRLTLANMSVHHLDVLRFLFGDPDEITTLTRKDPRTTFDHSDGITVSTLQFPSGVLAVSLEDVWSGPRAGGLQGRPAHQLARRRHRGRRQGHDRLADRRGLDADLRLGQDDRRRVGDADLGHDVVPARLHRRDGAAAARREDRHARRRSPVADNVKTMALVEAGYRSIDEGRAVKLSEISIN